MENPNMEASIADLPIAPRVPEDYAVYDCGLWANASRFPGVYLPTWSAVAIGQGGNPLQAFEDALENLDQLGCWDVSGIQMPESFETAHPNYPSHGVEGRPCGFTNIVALVVR